MPDIEITEDQRDRLRAVQEALASDVVGKYGHVRASDAVEYLLDVYEEGAEPGAEREGGETVGADAGRDGGPATGGANPTATAGGDADGGPEGAEASVETDAVDPDESADAVDSDEGDGAAGADDASGGTPTVAGGDAAELDAMMNLLAEHDDRWRESDAADARYEVDLPDGTTEHARTKDDVRGLLFRHYR